MPWLTQHRTGSRKQACNGSTPCDRCVEEDKECYYLEPRKRTPRTRLRIDELEERWVSYLVHGAGVLSLLGQDAN